MYLYPNHVSGAVKRAQPSVPLCTKTRFPTNYPLTLCIDIYMYVVHSIEVSTPASVLSLPFCYTKFTSWH